MERRRGATRRGRAAAVLVVAAALWAAPAAAQYFGRNKVQYENFDFFTLSTEHFRVYSYVQEGPVIRDSAAMAERWYSRFLPLFGEELEPEQPLILYADHADFQQTNVVNVMINQGTGGITEGMKNRIVLPLTGLYAENDHVIGHELVHAFQFTILKQGQRGAQAGLRMPLWFVEGMAEYLTLGRSDPLTAMWLRDGVLHDDVPSIDDIGSDPEYFPYRWGHALWAWIAERAGDDAVERLFRVVLAQGWDQGFKAVLNATPDELSKEWEADVRRTYEPLLAGRTDPEELGEPLIVEGLGRNWAPTISPDGRLMALLSQQDVFSIDLYLADASNGKILRKLADSSTDAHFDALRFMNSAGTWSPDGRRLAFVVYARGDNRLAIVDVASGDLERTVAIPGIDEMTSLAWSPDGRQIAIAGTSAGVGDLWLWGVEDGEAVRLTDDRFAELQPAWSPDGRTLAFATDRGAGTELDQLRLGRLKLALMDMATRRLRMLDVGGGARQSNPQFSPDGGSIYLIADPDGVPDIYRYDLAEDRYYRVTRVATAVSGLTEESPAMSVARQSGRMLLTVFSEREYHVRALPSEQLRGEPIAAADLARAAGTDLPPPGGEPDVVDAYLDDARTGLPPASGFATGSYDPALGLVYAGQFGVGVAVDRFGTSLGGGATFLFSDLLGNRVLIASAQVQGQIEDAGGQVLYQNLSGRWNWGAIVGHVPYRSLFLRAGRAPYPPDTTVTALTQELIIERTYLDRAAMILEYPVSANRRWEFTGGYTRIGYDYEVETYYFLPDGRFLSAEESELEAPSAVNLFQGAAAYVGDYSYFGFTSPVSGRRFRFEVEPTLGSLSFASFLADYRQYYYWRPLTFALRGLHYGRYFGDAEDDRLTTLFLGYETLVRGYEIDALDLRECDDFGEAGTCGEIDRLIGSRLGVFNAELRMTLLGTEEFGLLNFPYLPTELALFFDGGVAWTDDEPPTLTLDGDNDERTPVFSAGVAARVNILGALVLQTYLAWPFQRPGGGSDLGFVIAPGW